MRKTLKILSAILVFAVAAALSMGAFAANIKCEIDELKLTLELPDKFFVFTRDTEDLTLISEAFGIEAEDFNAYLDENDIYIDAVTEDYITEFLLVGTTSEDIQAIFDYNLLTEEEFEACKEPLKTAFEENGMTVSDISTFCGDKAKFFVISYTEMQSEQPVSGIRYSTIFNGMAVNLTLHSATSTIPEEKAEILKQIAESIEFTEILDIPESALRNKSPNYILIGVLTAAVVGGGVGGYLSWKKKKAKINEE